MCLNCSEEIQTTLHLNWIDNYSHFLKVQVPTGDATAWRDCQWTVHALLTTRNLRQTEDIDDDWLFAVEDPDERLMPADLFVVADKAHCLQLLERRRDAMLRNTEYFLTAACKDVRTLPLKPEPVVDSRESFLESAVFLPVAVLGHNIASNKGLMRVFSQTLRNYQTEGSRPILIMADINIYKRVLKVKNRALTLS